MLYEPNRDENAASQPINDKLEDFFNSCKFNEVTYEDDLSHILINHGMRIEKLFNSNNTIPEIFYLDINTDFLKLNGPKIFDSNNNNNNSSNFNLFGESLSVSEKEKGPFQVNFETFDDDYLQKNSAYYIFNKNI